MLIYLDSYAVFIISLSAAALSPDLSMLAGGFEDSAVRMWSLTPKKLQFNPTKSSRSRISLACDLQTADSEEQSCEGF